MLRGYGGDSPIRQIFKPGHDRDAADALAAAICHIHSSRMREMLRNPAALRQGARTVRQR